MIHAVVTGATGRMGQRIIRLLQDEEGIRLSGALERTDHPDAGKDIGELIGIGTQGIPLSTNVEDLLSGCDVFIDFTLPEATLPLFRKVSRAGISMVIGTTGFSDDQIALFRDAAAKTPHLLAPNMSVGVNLLFKILPEIAAALGPDYDVEILEAHHRFKKDAPSGTAVKLAEVIAKALHRNPETACVHGRHGLAGARTKEEIGMHAVRGGDIVGDHRVMFCGIGERVEIVHSASSRDTFARGAVRAAKWIVGKPAGLYSMLDVLEM
ncbi:MAG: 4-hydroxy-tetrahydrodipicolinate reductase [Deltaproteobacteria bacterium]|nr:4-hydroxy-tetrahydrodipicolinate reductase [Deltaproteobacteria bacterium]